MTTQTKQWRQSKPTFVPRPVQLRSVEKILTNHGTRIFLKPGRGKTAAVLKAFQVLRDKDIVDAMLVLAPLRVIMTSWPQQIEQWADFDGMTYGIIHGGQKGRRGAMESDKDVYLMNVEGLLRDEWKLTKKYPNRKKSPTVPNPYATKWLESKRVMIVVDESTKFSNPASARFKTLKAYLSRNLFSKRVILTGTPQPKKLENLFSQCYITDNGEDLGQYITHFRNLYMMPSPSGFGYEALPNAMNKVAAKIAPTTVEDEGSQEAAEAEEVDIIVKMPDDVRKRYNELKREFITLIEGQTVMAPNAGVLYGKMRQLAQGAIFTEEDKWVEVHPFKIMAMQNLLEELNGDPLFCLYKYRHDFIRLEKEINKGQPLPRIGGGVSAAAGVSYCRQFAAGGLPLLLGHPLSAAHGIDGLQASCNNVCWMGLETSWENYYQANLRIVRHGTTAERVSIYRVVTDCAVEWAALDMVRDRKSSEADLLSAIKDNILQE